MSQERWNEKEHKEFHENIHKISPALAPKVSTAYSEEEMLEMLEKCWEYKDSEIHKGIKAIYSSCEVFESNETLATSCNKYVRTVLSDRELLKSVSFDHILGCLDISERISIKLGLEQGNKCEVEDALLREREKRNEHDRSKCLLLNVAVTFLEELNIFPITISQNYPGVRPHFAGVYLIYYVGQTSLYEDLVSTSLDKPIYVGKSEKDILNRLSDHRRKMARAKDLEVTDFVVRIMTVNPKFYAPAIEAALIYHYNPLWNNNTVKLSFGNAKDNKNNWYTYHVAMVKYKRKKIIKRVRDFQHHQ